MEGCQQQFRHVAARDRAAVCRIAADTAQYGDPVELILDDRRLFTDVFVRPYLDLCAETCWIAVVDDIPAGYLTGCVDTHAVEPYFRRALGRAVLRALVGRYRVGRRTLRAGIGYVREVIARPPTADLGGYPAHLHINIAKGYRGLGLGRQLMIAFLDQCRTLGVPGVHLSTSDQNVAALSLYHALGFEVLARYRSPYKSTVSRKPVETVIMGLRLDQG